jgi:glycosyltransferase involved in cell wall biosynthesis
MVMSGKEVHMRILRVVASIDPNKGGVSSSVDYAATTLNSTGDFTVDVLCLDDPANDWLASASRTYKIFALGPTYNKYGFNFKFMKWLWTNIASYDFVIIDGVWRFHVISGFFCKVFNVPYAVMPHGMLDPYFKRDNIKYFIKIPFWFFLDGPCVWFSKFLMFTCEREKELAKGCYPFYSFQGFVTRLGFDFNHTFFNGLEFREKYNIDPEKKILLFLSRIDGKKGIETLIGAVRENIALMHDWVVVIAGPGEPAYIDYLKFKTKELEVEDKVLWVGSLYGDAKWSAYKAARFFVLPSHQENYGIVNVEALSIGVPLVITKTINIYQDIDSYNAAFCSEDNLLAYSRALSSAISVSEDEYSILSENARKCYLENFTEAVFLKDFYNLKEALGF